MQWRRLKVLGINHEQVQFCVLNKSPKLNRYNQQGSSQEYISYCFCLYQFFIEFCNKFQTSFLQPESQTPARKINFQQITKQLKFEINNQKNSQKNDVEKICKTPKNQNVNKYQATQIKPQSSLIQNSKGLFSKRYTFQQKRIIKKIDQNNNNSLSIPYQQDNNSMLNISGSAATFSRDFRQSANKTYTKSNKNYKSPGPGSYQPKLSRSSSKTGSFSREPKDTSQTLSLKKFHQGCKQKLQSFPGPGAYSPKFKYLPIKLLLKNRIMK